MKLSEFKAANPAYQNVPDDVLADALHAKFYSEIPKSDFYSQVGLTAKATEPVSNPAPKTPPIPEEKKTREQKIAEMDAATDPMNPGYMPLTDAGVSATQTVGRGQMDAKRSKYEGRVLDSDIPPVTAGSLVQDFASGAIQIPLVFGKGVGEAARLLSGDTVGKGLTEAIDKGIRAVQNSVGSSRGQAQRTRFQQDVEDKNLTAVDVIAANPGALADEMLPQVGSMVLPIGAAGLAGKAATSSRAAILASAIDEATVLQRANRARELAAIGATVVQNAANTYSELRDKGADQASAYGGAAITVPATVAAGFLTGGGAEAQVAKMLAGQKTKAGALSVLKAGAKEGAPEVGEEAGQYAGELYGLDGEFDIDKAAKRGAIAFTMGAAMGGGVNLTGQARGALADRQQKNAQKIADAVAAAELATAQRVAAIDSIGQAQTVDEAIASSQVALSIPEESTQAITQRILEVERLQAQADPSLQEQPLTNQDAVAAPVTIDGETSLQQAPTEGQEQVGLPVNENAGAVNAPEIDSVLESSNQAPDALPQAADLSTTQANAAPVVLQNRNRSTPASIAQMQSIAKAPDYGRLGFSRDFANGAPVVAGTTYTIPKKNRGRKDIAVASDGKKIPIQYAVVDAGRVLASNQADGSINAEYGGTKNAIRAIAGNGRIAGLQSAYANNTATQYVSDLSNDMELHGIPPAAIEGIKQPVLVRLMNNADITPNIGDLSNTQTNLQLSAVEQANNDAARVDLGALTFSNDGAVTPEAIRQFVQAMPPSERGGLIDTNGQPSRQAADRIQAAVFAKAYGNDGLVRLFAQAQDPEARLIMSALARVAPKMARLDGAGALDIRSIVSQAAEIAVNARRSGKSLAMAAQQVDMMSDPDVGLILNLFAENPRSNSKVIEALSNAADFAYRESNKAEVDMFGAVDKATREDVLRGLDNEQRSAGNLENAQRGKPVQGDVGGRDVNGRAGANAATTQEGRPTQSQPASEVIDGLLAASSTKADAGNTAKSQAADKVADQKVTSQQEQGATKASQGQKFESVQNVANLNSGLAGLVEPSGNAEGNLSGQTGLKMSRKDKLNKDTEYLAAVERGDMDAAQKMVDQAALDAGYITASDYRMEHQAPNSDGDVSLVDLRASGLVPEDYWTHPQWYQTTPEERNAFASVTAALRRHAAKVAQGRPNYPSSMTVYRAVPKDVKDDFVRNGDWVTPSRDYAALEGEEISGGYRIITQQVLLKNVYWDGNSIAELGVDDGKGYAYKNTKNNRKLVDAVTYDDEGNVISLSQRFNTRSDDVRRSKTTTAPRVPATSTVSQIRNAISRAYGNGLISKLESKGLVVIVENEADAVEAVALARSEKLGGDVEKIKRQIMSSVMAQRAYHGTPHRGIKQFSTEKIGTGEGAQAYGWGLYFASKQDIAEHYRTALSYREMARALIDQLPYDADFQDALNAARDMSPTQAALIRELAADDWLGFDYPAQAITAAFKEIDAYDASPQLRKAVSEAQGQLYEVEIPEDSDMLLWDRPMSDQPPAVLRAVESVMADFYGADYKMAGAVAQTLKGKGVVEWLGKTQEGSRKLAEAGIKGIKYLDGSSRAAREGSYNYVIFDDADVQIVDVKYSSLGAIEGFFDSKTGKSFLIASNLTEQSAPGTLMHEVGIHMAASGKLEPLFKRAANLLKIGKNNEFIRRVQKRLDAAGETSSEEAAAYIVTEYENNRVNAPASVVSWINDLMASVRAWFFRNGIVIKSDQLTIADIAAVARANARSIAENGLPQNDVVNGKEYQSSSREGMLRSIAIDEDTGLPLNPDGTVTVYHHTNATSAAAIRRTGMLKAQAEPDVYATTHAETDTGYGDTAVPIRIDPTRLQIDDEFPNGRKDFRISVGRPGGSIRVKVESGNGVSFSRADPSSLPETMTIDGQERSTTNSKGQSIASTREGIENFYRWFGDSQVVDAEGRPAVIYHDGRPDFTGIKGDYRFGSAIFVKENSPAGYSENTYELYLRGEILELDQLHDELQTDAGREALAKALRLDVTDDALDSVAEALTDGSNYPDDPVVWDAIRAIDEADAQSEIQKLRGKLAKIFGYQAVRTPDEFDGETLMVVDPVSIKSATGNAGAFDPENPDIRFSRRSPRAPVAAGATPNWQIKKDGRIERLIYEFQDSRVDLKRTQEAIVAHGRAIEEKFDARLAETLNSSRIAYRKQTFEEIEVNPLLAAMAVNRVSMNDLSDYLHARGAKDRNAQVAKVNPSMPDGGAGKNTQGVLMTNQAAQDYLIAIPASRKQKLDFLAAKVDAITKGTRELLVTEGLEKRDTIQAWEAVHKNYVPMFRDEAESGNPHPTGGGLSVRGSSSKRVTGSTKEVTNILAHVVMQREAAIGNAENNRVQLALYGLALSNPNFDVWATIRPDMQAATIAANLQAMGVNPLVAEAGMQGVPTVRTVDPILNKVVDRPNPMYKSLPGAIVLRIDGEDRVLMLNQDNPRALRMAQNLKSLDGLTRIDLASSIVGKSTRWMAAVNTQYNPAFGVLNGIRDTWGAFFNLSSTYLRGKSSKVIFNAFIHAGPAIAQELLKPGGNGKWAKLYRQFQEDGGKMGFSEIFKDANDRQKNLESKLKLLEQGNFTPRKALSAIGGLLEGFNTTIENAVRLSAYSAALDANPSRPQAARLARELTVDFNRKGRAGRELGPLYAFFNASLQGGARTVETLKGPAGARIITGGLVLGALQPFLLAMAGLDDDEIPESVKTRAYIIPLFNKNKNYVAIPMSLGLHVIPTVGRVISELALNGGKDFGKRTFNAIGEVAGAFNPLGGGNIFTADGALKTIAPTILDPLIEIGFNKNFAGSNIELDVRGETDVRPGFARARESTQRALTGQAYLWFSKLLNTASLGSDYKAGLVSPTPERLQYLAQVAGGGVLREIEKTINLAYASVNGDTTKLNRVPLIGRLFGEVDEDAVSKSRYYESSKRLDKIQGALSAAHKAGDAEAMQKIMDKDPEFALYDFKDDVSKQISKLNKLAVTTINDREQLKRIDEIRVEYMKQLNEAIRLKELESKGATSREQLKQYFSAE